jgi:F-type H+-transporting ATPase subunit b
MDLLNQVLNNFSTQLSDSGGSLISDIFEANLVNLVLLVGGLFYILSDALSESLSKRQQKILLAIQESEEKLQEATTKLTESEIELAQITVLVTKIQQDSDRAATLLRTSILNDSSDEIARLTFTSQSQIRTMETRARKELSDYLATAALKRFTEKLKQLFIERKAESNRASEQLRGKLMDKYLSKINTFLK